jgi:hypothetical protein
MEHSIFVIDPQTGEPKGCTAAELMTPLPAPEPPAVVEPHGTEKQAANRPRKE